MTAMEAMFIVGGREAPHTVKVTWDATGTDKQRVEYSVSAGPGNEHDVKVNVLLKVPAVSAAAVSAPADGSAVAKAFSDNRFDYFVLSENVLVGPGETSPGTFAIVSNRANHANTLLDASLIAVGKVVNDEPPAPPGAYLSSASILSTAPRSIVLGL